MTRSDLKARARAQLGGGIFKENWLMALLVCLIASIILNAAAGLDAIIIHSNGSVSEVMSLLSLALILILNGPIKYGINSTFLKQTRDGEMMFLSDLFSGFSKDFTGTFLLGLMISIFTSLWSLLLVIPGIVKAYAYSMSYFVKCDHPEYNWHQCINESRRLMAGHKGELFVLDLSFIGWYLVGTLCLGIGVFWVTPYNYASHSQFYENLQINDSMKKLNGGNAPYGQFQNGQFQNGQYQNGQFQGFQNQQYQQPQYGQPQYNQSQGFQNKSPEYEDKPQAAQDPWDRYNTGRQR